MKTFRYALGHEALKTMTVSELIEKLSAYPADMPVVGAWEGISAPIRPDGFSVDDDYHWGEKADACQVLEINVDQY